jgi:hypothetical protein
MFAGDLANLTAFVTVADQFKLLSPQASTVEWACFAVEQFCSDTGRIKAYKFHALPDAEASVSDFLLKGVDRMLPAGDYRVVTDEELLDGPCRREDNYAWSQAMACSPCASSPRLLLLNERCSTGLERPTPPDAPKIDRLRPGGTPQVRMPSRPHAKSG